MRGQIEPDNALRGSVTDGGSTAMTAKETQMRGARACAGVVLYRPDKGLLARQAEGLRGLRLFAFANGPVDAEALAALAPTDLHLIESEENVGLGRGLNVVMETAASEGFTHVMLLDQDSEPPRDLLDRLTSRCTALEELGDKIAVVAPRLVPPQEGFYKPIRYEWRRGGNGRDLAALDFAPTSGSLVSLAAFEAVGPFRDDFFIAGIDVEWGFRAWDRGWGSYLATDLVMPHRWGEAVSEEDLGKPQILRHSKLRNYYYVRNVVAVARLRHVPLAWRAKSSLALVAQIALLALKGQPGALRPVFKGIRDGLAGRLCRAPGDVVF